MKEQRNPNNRPDSLSLLPQDLIEKSPVIIALKKRFSAMLPKQFGPPRTYISPHPSMQSVLRSDCQNRGCGTRALMHIARTEQGTWETVEEKPIYDRTNNSTCDDCHLLLQGK